MSEIEWWDHFVLENPRAPHHDPDSAAAAAEADLAEAFEAKQDGGTDADLAMSLKSKGYVNVTGFKIVKGEGTAVQWSAGDAEKPRAWLQIQVENQLDELTQELLKLHKSNIKMWEFNMERSKIGQVFLRLMISIKTMSGGRMGEFGYLNYLKNNLGNAYLGETFIVEDKFGNNTSKRLRIKA